MQKWYVEVVESPSIQGRDAIDKRGGRRGARKQPTWGERSLSLLAGGYSGQVSPV